MRRKLKNKRRIKNKVHRANRRAIRDGSPDAPAVRTTRQLKNDK